MWKPRLAALVLPLFAAGGCFYVQEINERPSVQIRQLSDDPVLRGGTFMLEAVSADPEDDSVVLQWRAYACEDANDFLSCEQTPFKESRQSMFEVTTPKTYSLDGVNPPTQSLLIILEAKDEKGATARPRAELIVPVLDAAPTVDVRSFSKYENVENTPIDLFALVQDLDDSPDALTVTWALIGFPDGANRVLLDADPATTDVPTDPSKRQYNKQFTPDTPGEYTFEVTAQTTLATTTCNGGPCVGTGSITITVGEDRAPCIQQTLPLASPTGAPIPVTAPTLFRVPVISDDLDGYPIIPDDSIAGAPTFTWSVKAPGQPTYAAQPGVIGNSIAFDPATYALGDFVDIRVEIKDRKLTPVNCPVGDPFCSTISSASCVQRVTWHVEVR